MRIRDVYCSVGVLAALRAAVGTGAVGVRPPAPPTRDAGASGRDHDESHPAVGVRRFKGFYTWQVWKPTCAKRFRGWPVPPASSRPQPSLPCGLGWLPIHPMEACTGVSSVTRPQSASSYPAHPQLRVFRVAARRGKTDERTILCEVQTRG
jgi:hypothetical protein